MCEGGSSLSQVPRRTCADPDEGCRRSRRETAERTCYVEAQISEVDKLLNRGNTDDALRVIQRACQRFADNTRLQSTSEMVRERLQHEKTERLKKACLQKAQEEIGRFEYDALESAQEQLPSDSEVAELLQQVRGRVTETTREKRIDKSRTSTTRRSSTSGRHAGPQLDSARHNNMYPSAS